MDPTFNRRVSSQSEPPSDAEASQRNMSLRRRRSGLRSNKKRLLNTANDALDPRKLRSIPEEGGNMRDLSSSERPPKVHAKLLNDTILEE